MFAKNLTVPINLVKSEALEKRTPKNHPILSDLKQHNKNLRSGYNGERKINYYLSQLPYQRFYIFHDLRLPYGNGYFQIDALLLSSKSILMVDGKNHSGKLTIEKKQMIQEYKDNRVVYENPILQANRHNLLLKFFFEKHKIPLVPIDSLVTICKSSTEVCISPGYTEAEKKVCRVGDLLRKIDEFFQFKKEILDKKLIDKIKKLLLKEHTPLNIDIYEHFSIEKLEIVPGVQCPNCLAIPMNYKRKYWVCPICQFVSKEAYLTAIKDYFLLMDSSFTNKELRMFLRLPSSRATTYFLSLLNLPYTGTTKDRVYHLPNDFL